MKKTPINLKKVKIDDHIKNSKKGNGTATPAKRGRPRKTPELSSIPGNAGSSRDSSSVVIDSQSVDSHIDDAQLQEVQPVYDTTEEAKGFLRAPFDIAAGLSGIPRLALYPSQLDALAPSFKIAYDKRIAPKLGEDADLIAFAVVVSGVLFEKVAVWKEETGKNQKAAEAANLNTENRPPFIPTEHTV